MANATALLKSVRTEKVRLQYQVVLFAGDYCAGVTGPSKLATSTYETVENGEDDLLLIRNEKSF